MSGALRVRRPEDGLEGGWGPREVLRLVWRAIVAVGVIGAGVVEVVVRRPKTRAARAAWLHGVCRRLLGALGISVQAEGVFPRDGVLMTNHEGYLDILALCSLAPCVFVSKAEVGQWPVVGWISKMAGTVYVERGKGGSGAAASVRIREAAEAGISVVFFPEGTTSDGRGLLPFHGGLIAESREAGLPIRVGVIRYRVGGPAGATVGGDVAYWGERGMLSHMARFLTLRGLEARIRFGEEPLVFTTEERKAAAAEARAAMLRLGGGSVLDLPAPEQM